MEFRKVVDHRERSYGVLLRVLGIDFLLLFLGWFDDWMVIDCRLPCRKGIYLQIWFVVLAIGRLPDDTIYVP